MSIQAPDLTAGYGDLADLLAAIERFDTDYPIRQALVLTALAQAYACGLKAGVRIDPAEPEWPVAYVELPSGQVSWHMPQHDRPFDGHSTEEKYRRCAEFIAQHYREEV